MGIRARVGHGGRILGRLSLAWLGGRLWLLGPNVAAFFAKKMEFRRKIPLLLFLILASAAVLF
jgi:hypothetical protein